MFDVGWPELLVIAIVLIVVVGPQDLPRMLRAFGKATARMRTMASEFRTQFDEALKEADLDDVRKTISDAQNLNPTKSLRDAMNPLRQVGEDIRSGLNDAVKPGSLKKPDEAEPTESPAKQNMDIGAPAPALNGSGASADPSPTANGDATPKPKPRKTAKAKAASSSKTNGKTAATAANGKAPKSTGGKSAGKSAKAVASKSAAPPAVGEAAPIAAKAPATRTRKPAAAKAASSAKKAASRKRARKSGDEADV